MRKRLLEMALFAQLAVFMLISKLLLEFFPNVHLLAMLTVTFTLVFRAKALIIIYSYVFLNGLVSGFNVWWVPYLYIWTVLWGIVMLLPKNMPKKIAIPVYIIVCGLHGFLYGTLYAPAQALMFGLNFKETIGWIIAGIPFDVIHGVSNLLVGTLIVPLVIPLKKLWVRMNNI